MFPLGNVTTRMRQSRSERGAAAVEFALVIPLLLLLLFGIIDLGRMYATNMAFTSATREVARAVSIAGINPSGPTQDAVMAAMMQAYDGAGLDRNRLTIVSTSWCATTTSIATVQARYRYQFITPASAFVTVFLPNATAWGGERGMTHTAWFRCS